MIQVAKDLAREWVDSAIEGWNRFWFRSELPHTLALMRILVGGIVFYTHLVWLIGFNAFLGSDAQISPEFAKLFHSSGWAWSLLDLFSSPGVLRFAHMLALLVALMFTVGLFTRWTSVLIFLVTISFVHRLPGALFGLDQINCFLVMYLMLSDCGAVYSLDARRRGGQGRAAESRPTVLNNIATRLIQIHMCIVYLFAALGKLQGMSWWEGNAMWLALANSEYQTIDMTWLADWPLLVNFLTFVVIAWELTYIALIWPRWTRPLMLLLAIPVHLGIAFAMGMATFGLVMLFGNLALVCPKLVRDGVDVPKAGFRAGGESVA